MEKTPGNFLLGAESAISGNGAPTNKQENVVKATVPAAAVESVDGVRRVTPAEYKAAAQCLAEAFADDDVARYFTHTPDREHWTEEQRWELHVSILEYIVYAHILKGVALTVGPDYGCVALW